MEKTAIKRIFPAERDVAAWRGAWRTARVERERSRMPIVWWRRAIRRAIGVRRHDMRRLPPLPAVRWLVARSLRLRTNRIELGFADVPRQFDGFEILHLSDFHLDHVAGTVEAIVGATAGLRCDLLVFTGDFQDHDYADPDLIAQAMLRIVDGIDTRAGALGVLGNHDSAALVEPLERAGITMLLNETIELRRGAERMLITGADDVHYFHTPQADRALASCPEGFAIALVHSAEAADQAAARHRLMLCGHTHGGQICLPGGYAPVRALKRHRGYYRGLWRHGDMVGFTTNGIGMAVVPFRLFCPAEIVQIVLRRA